MDLIKRIEEAEERGRRELNVRYCPARGSTLDEMRTHIAEHPLYECGDAILVWVNEGDIIMHGEAIEARATATTPPES